MDKEKSKRIHQLRDVRFKLEMAMFGCKDNETTDSLSELIEDINKYITE